MPDTLYVRLKPDELETHTNLCIRIEALRIELTVLEAKRDEILDGGRRADREYKASFRANTRSKGRRIKPLPVKDEPDPITLITPRTNSRHPKKATRNTSVNDQAARSMIFAAIKAEGEPLAAVVLLVLPGHRHAALGEVLAEVEGEYARAGYVGRQVVSLGQRSFECAVDPAPGGGRPP